MVVPEDSLCEKPELVLELQPMHVKADKIKIHQILENDMSLIGDFDTSYLITQIRVLGFQLPRKGYA